MFLSKSAGNDAASTKAGLPQQQNTEKQQQQQQPHQKASPTTSSPSRADEGVRHGQFTIQGSRGHFKKYALIPAHEDMTAAVWSDIFSAWKLKAPNLLIWFKTGTLHPMKIVGSHLSKTEQYQSLMQDVAASCGAPPDDPSQNSTANSALETVNRILFNKLKAVMDGICNAADQTNSWVLVVGSPAQGEVLLEESLKRSVASPVVLVVDNLDSSKYRSNNYSLAMTQELVNSAVPLATPCKKIAELSGDLWNPEKNKEPPAGSAAAGHKHFLEAAEKTGEPLSWDFDTTSDPRADGHPWFSWPFRGGTHYILFQSPQDMEAHDLAEAARISSVAPMGYIFCGGGNNTLGDIKSGLSKAMPAVLLKNTGRVTQQWSLALEAIKSHSNPATMEATKLLEAVRAGYDEGALKPKYRFTLPDAIEVLDNFKSRPEVFVDTLAVVDPLVDSPERVLNVLTRCFASTATGAVELGVGSAQSNVVLAAWRIQADLDHNARRQQRASDLLMGVALTFTFLSTAATVFTAQGEAVGWIKSLPEDVQLLAKGACYAFPALSGLITTVVSRLRLASKWATLELAAGQVVSEIYSYRTSTGRYNLLARAASAKKLDKAETSKAEEEHGNLSREARMLFIRRVQQIATSVCTSDMKTDALHNLDGAELFQKDSQELRQHVEKRVLRSKLPSLEDSKKAVKENDTSKDSAESTVALLVVADRGTDFDDFVSPISTEAFIEWRVRPTLARLRATTPRLACELVFLEVLVFAFATFGTLLAAFELTAWVPVSVALGSALSALLYYRGLQAKLEAKNRSMSEVQNILTHWSGLSIVDRRMPGIKQHVVQSLEKAVLSEVAANVSGAAAFNSSSDAGEEDDGEGCEEEGDKKSKKKAA